MLLRPDLLHLSTTAQAITEVEIAPELEELPDRGVSELLAAVLVRRPASADTES